MKAHFILFSVIVFPILLYSQTDTCACCSEKHKEFDFWLGKWEVFNLDGTVAGTNSITKIQDDCVVKEEWRSAKDGYTGTSYNFFNQQTQQWEQLWIDNQGTSLHLRGNKKENQMILISDELKNPNGETIYHTITWTARNDGTIRQLWQTTTEAGRAIVVFDGLYKKVE